MRAAGSAIAVALASLAVCAPPSRAEPVSILGIQSIDTDEVYAARLTRALRKAVRARADLELLPGKDVVELRFVLGCDDELTLGPCLSQAGDSLGADRLVFGLLHGRPKPTADKHGRGDPNGAQAGKIRVTLDLLDVKTRAIIRGVNATVDAAELTEAAIPFNAERWLKMLLPPPAPATPASRD